MSVYATDLLCRFQNIREGSLKIAAPLSAEDASVQSMPDASPIKWHLAHTTWFFETFVLAPHYEDYQAFHPRFNYLFNSYYNSVGAMHPRPRRGLLSRPSLAEVLSYRQSVDTALAQLLAGDVAYIANPNQNEATAEAVQLEVAELIELGLNHEQQHQELMLTDILHALSCNPLAPAYREDLRVSSGGPAEHAEQTWFNVSESLVEIGNKGNGFAFDNERPRHRRFLDSFALASRPVSNQEYAAFVDDGGYDNDLLWLSDGRDISRKENWQHPLYWSRGSDGWYEFTLGGLRPLDAHAPVSHISFYEAEAFSTWSGLRLPTEVEWETVADKGPNEGNLLEAQTLHPMPCVQTHDGPKQMFGDVWEWTASPYTAYPGYRAAEGALGEYNGKFM